MALGALNWTTIQFPFSAGLETKGDARVADPPSLDVARDVHFEETDGLQTRRPMVAMSNNIFGGGTLSNCRRPAVINDELCVFTDSALYSWNAQLTKWVLRGMDLAVDIDEQARFVTQDDQLDSDRAELAGTVIYAWSINVSGGSVATYVAAVDKVTGSVLMSPTALGSAAFRPRLVALATKILLFWHDLSNSLLAIAIDPASPATALGGAATTILASNANLYYDVVKAGTQDLCVGAIRRTTTTSYTAFTASSGLSVTTATKARTCDGPIAVATVPDGTQTQVIRGNGTNIQGDLLTTSSLADVFTGQAIGTAASTTINHITVAFADSASARAFWTSGSAGENTGVTDFEVKTNTVTTSNSVGSQASFRQRLGIASHAFAFGGHVYVWLTFAQDSGVSVTGNASAVRAQLQHTYFLYRDDKIVVSQCARQAGGGFNVNTGRLTSVALIGGSTQFAWCPSTRRRIEVGGTDHSSFESRSPIDVVFTFDSNLARRAAAIGKTLYVTGGIPLQYDGVQLAEVGFLVYPWYFEPQVGGAGNLAAGTYTWRNTLRWPNAQGEVDRSTTATGMSLTVAASKFVFLNHVYTNVTLKIAPRPIALDFWRTPVNVEAPYYRVNSVDPNALPGANNGYVTNDDTLSSSGIPLPDNYADATLITKETSPSNSGGLEFLAPPGAKTVVATDTRLFLAGVSGNSDAVCYSRERGDAEVVSFHEQLAFDVPRAGGDITAIAFLDKTLIAFRETAIYAFAGPGFDNLGRGQNFELARTISTDVGAVSQEAVVSISQLGLLFKSSKGWQLIDQGGGLHYVGGAVAAFDGDTVNAMHVTTAQHQVRILTNARLLLWDYRGLVDAADSGPGLWGEWTISDGVGAVMWQGQYVYLTATGPKIEQASYSGLTYGQDVEIAWLKPNGPQGFAMLGAIQVLGEYRSSCLVRIRVARDYQYDGAGNPLWFDDKAWAPSPTVVGSALQVRHCPTQGQGEAYKVRITAVTDAARALLLADVAGGFTIATDSTRWAAVLQAVPPGEMGNLVTISIAFVDGGTAPFSLDVREHFAYNTSLSRWTEDLSNIGVLVTMTATSRPTVLQLENAITAGATHLATVAIPDNPAKILAASNIGTTRTATLTGGAYGSPTGEAFKLSALGFEVGIDPRLNRRLAAAQKQ